jgi:hypothetical protein
VMAVSAAAASAAAESASVALRGSSTGYTAAASVAVQRQQALSRGSATRRDSANPGLGPELDEPNKT